MGGDRESQPHIHARRITLNRRVQKALDFSKGNNLIEFFTDFFPRHSENRAVQENVFAPAKFGMETSANFQQARNAPSKLNLSLCRLGNTAEDLQQRTFAGAIAADDAENFALLTSKLTSF